jgi:hypothetical protein
VVIAFLGWPSTTYLFYRLRQTPLSTGRLAMMAASCLAAGAISTAVWLIGMRSGVRALEAMSD